MLYLKVLTDLGEVDKKSENIGKQIPVKTNLPLKGMSERDLDIFNKIYLIRGSKTLKESSLSVPQPFFNRN